MSTDPNSYIAWDGMQYPGDPPTDWFLAADNRWWPPREVIDGTSAADDAPPPPATTPPTAPPVAMPRSSVPPPDSWAPDSNDVFNRTSTEPARQQPRPQISRPNQRPRKRGGFRGFGFIIFLIIAFGRCTANSFDDAGPNQDLPQVTVPTLPPTTAEPFDPSGEPPDDVAVPTTADPGSGSVPERNTGTVVTEPGRILTDTVEANLFPCSGQGTISGTATNRGPEPRSFVVAVQIEYLKTDGGTTEVVARDEQVTFGPIDPLQTAEWSIASAEENGLIVGCTILSAAPADDS